LFSIGNQGVKKTGKYTKQKNYLKIKVFINKGLFINKKPKEAYAG